MSNFKIPVYPKSSQKTIRFPNEIIERVEKAIEGKDSSFSCFFIEATRFALKELEKE